MVNKVLRILIVCITFSAMAITDYYYDAGLPIVFIIAALGVSSYRYFTDK